MKKINWIAVQNYNNWLWVVSWLIPMLIYLTTVSRHITGYGDSDELIYSGYLGGVAHPPGYPMLVFILHLWLKLFSLDVAFGSNLLGLIIQTSALALLWLLIKEVITIKTHHASLVATLMVWGVAIMPLFWLNANTFEVFGLNNLLSLLVVWKVLKLKSTPKDWLFLGLLWGIAINHHQLALLLGPTINYKWWQEKNWKLAGWGLGGIFVALAFYFLAMYFFALRGSWLPVSWRLDSDIGSIFNHLIRKDFSGVLLETGGIQNAYFKNFNLSDSFGGLITFIFKLLPLQIGWVLWSLVGTGFYQLIKNYRQNWLLNWLIIPGILLVIYLPIDWQVGSEKILVERMYLWTYVSIIFISSIGLRFLINKYEKYTKLIFGAVILSLMWQVYQTYPLVNLRTWDGHYRSLISTFSSVEKDGRFVCFSDVSCFGLIYLQTVENFRTDIHILPITPQLNDRQLIKARQLSGRYRDNPFRVAEFVAKTIRDSGNIYFTEFNSIYTEWLGIGTAGKLLASNGYGLKFGCQAEVNDNSWLNLNSVKQASLNPLINQNNEIVKFKRDLVNLNPHNLDTSNCGTEVYLLAKARECAKSKSSCTLGNYLMLSEIFSEKYKYRLEFADWLMSVNAPELAKREYQQVLQLNPDNWQVKELLDSMKNVSDLEEL